MLKCGRCSYLRLGGGWCGVGVLDMYRPSDSEKAEPYELFDADLWKCPSCGFEVVGGFGYTNISAHYDPDFQKFMDGYKKRGVIENNG